MDNIANIRARNRIVRRGLTRYDYSQNRQVAQFSKLRWDGAIQLVTAHAPVGCECDSWCINKSANSMDTPAQACTTFLFPFGVHPSPQTTTLHLYSSLTSISYRSATKRHMLSYQDATGIHSVTSLSYLYPSSPQTGRQPAK